LALIRLLDFALLTFLVWLVWSQVIRGWRAARAAAAPPENHPGGQRDQAAPRQPGDAAAQEPLTLVRCGVCGVHVPSGRTLPGPAGQVFCSDSCRARAAARQTV